MAICAAAFGTTLGCVADAPAVTTATFPTSWDDMLDGGYDPVGPNGLVQPTPSAVSSAAAPVAQAAAPAAAPTDAGRLGSVLLKNKTKITGTITQQPGKYVIVVDEHGAAHTFAWDAVEEVSLAPVR